MAAKKKTDPNYGELAEELDTILQSIEGGEVDIDDLSLKMERATELIASCRKKLESTQLRVQKVLATLEEEEETEEEESEEEWEEE